jgi:hypothetical protein
MRFEETSRENVKIVDQHTFEPCVVTMVSGNLIGTTPRIEGGWTLISVIEHLQGGNILTNDDERAEQYRQAKPNCDHCQAKRNRSKTVLVANAAGEIKQVGLQCMKDYLGYHNSPEALLGYAKGMSELSDFSGYAIPVHHSVLEVLVAATKVVRVRGFASTSSESALPTNIIVDWCLGYLPAGGTALEEASEMVKEIGKTTEEDIALATDCLDWVLSLSESSEGYLGNLRAACAGTVAEKQALIVSGVQAYAKHLDKQAEAAQTEVEVKGYVRQGSNIQITGTVVSLKYVSGYGYNAPDVLKMVVKVEQDNGVVRLWGSVPASIESLVERGSKVSFIATIEQSDERDFGFFKRPRKAEVEVA